MKAELVPVNGDPPIPLVRDVTVVGRREGCDVQIASPGLSKRHCVVVRTDGLLVIRDLVTTNGTKVNGQRVRWAALMPNDRISMGGYKMRVYLGPDSAPSPSELAGRPARPAAPPAPAPAAAPDPTPPPVPAVMPTAAPVGFQAPSPLEAPLILADDEADADWIGAEDLVAGEDAPDEPVRIRLDDDDIIELD